MSKNDKTRLKKEQAKELLEENFKHIKRTIKKKISAHYNVLDYETSYKEFLEWIQSKDYEVIREIPGDSNFVAHIEALAGKFLIEKTYWFFVLEDHDLVTKFVARITNNYDIPQEFIPDIEDFVRKKLEDRNRLQKVKKKFKERSQLKSYFYVIIRNLIKDYQKKHNVRELKKIGSGEGKEIEEIAFKGSGPHIKMELKEIIERVDRLDYKEKNAFKMYFFKNIKNLNAIGRTLKTTRHKAKKILKNAVEKVLSGGV